MDLPKLYEISHKVRMEIERLTTALNSCGNKYREVCSAIEDEEKKKTVKK